MTKNLIALRIRVAKSIEGRIEAGQGTLEYVGMILVVAVIVAAVMTALSGFDFAGKVKTAIQKVIDAAG